MKNNSSTRLLVASIFGCIASTAAALGFGTGSSTAVLGQPLDFSVPLRVESASEFSPECVSAEVSFGDTRLGSLAVTVRTEGHGPDSPGRVRVTTRQVIDEPVVTLMVRAGCRSPVSRQFVLFADPPTLRGAASPASPGSAPVAAGASAPAATARPQAAPAPSASAPPRERRRPPRATASTSPAAPRGTPPSRAADPGAAPQARPGARLQLDPLDVPAEAPGAAAGNVSGPGGLRLSRALEAQPAASDAQSEQRREVAAAMWKALNTAPEDIVRDNERLAALEASLQQLREESAQTRRSLEAMNTRLQAAQAERSSSTLVYGLAALCAALAALALWLWARARRAAAHQWWDPDAQAAFAAQRDSRLAAEAAASGIDEETPQDAWHEPPTRLGRGKTAPGSTRALDAPTPRNGPLTTQAAPFLAERTAVMPRPAAQAMPLPVAPAPELAPAGKVSVEELIDLEQQAEFFEALGQDESAIDLLLSHVTEHPDASPLPYLKLLEIYQRRGDREAYEGTRQRFNDRFNAYAPAWEEDQRDGRSLEDYPSVISRLQGLWETPQRALDVLQASLLRRDETTQTFDLPAYRELLMLYSVARDRVGMDDGQTGVDVLLPLDGDMLEDDYTTRLEPLTATTPVRPYDGPEPAVEVDLQLELDDDWGRSHVLVHANEAAEPPPSSPAPSPPAEPPIYDRGIAFEPIHLDLPDTGRARGPDRKE